MNSLTTEHRKTALVDEREDEKMNDKNCTRNDRDKLEKEIFTRISINEQDQQVHETYTREQWRAWDNYDERQEEMEREQRIGMLDWPR